ncbi:MAG: cupin domain-containing protein [Pyrinomonadaceae bacterium]|nr:cupin domain-containing protein [Pyrinomonadaceae bacterium]MBP6214273.1 cupin domain-containing protein [Pyrinomonadaceae bacterium]
MKFGIIALVVVVFGSSFASNAQTREPSTPKSPIVVKSRQQVADIQKLLEKKPGNTNEDIVAPGGMQTRVAVFHDEKRENDMNEVHDGSDDVYYVLDGTATLLLGGSLVDAKEISPGEWRSKTATGGQRYTIRKGDIVFVPRGTPHQRTVTGKGFSMILIKIFAATQPAK